MSWPQMTGNEGVVGAVGFFGKLPAIGDFVHRRLPDDFLAAWDHWLQDVVFTTRNAFGEAWLDHYLVAPFWRFLLVPGVIGPSAWMGVMMPSVDRVGRYFPFTLAVPIPGNVNFGETFIGAHGWFEALEELGAQALNPQMELAEWDGRLSLVPMPPLVLAGLEEDATIPLVTGRAGPVALPMPGVDLASSWRLVSALAGFRRPFSIFSGIAREHEGRVALALEGLPGDTRCHSLFDGRWAENGWATPAWVQAAPASPLGDTLLNIGAGLAPVAPEVPVSETTAGIEAEDAGSEVEHTPVSDEARTEASLPKDIGVVPEEPEGQDRDGEQDDTLPLQVARQEYILAKGDD